MLTKLSWLVFMKYKSWLDLFSVCVFGIHVLKIGVKRWFWEVYMVFRSLVVLHVWLHSCLCFSLLKKNCFKSLLDTSSTPGYLSSFQAFSYCNLDTSSTPSGSIEKVPISSIASRQLGRSIDRVSVLDMVVCSSTHARHQHLSTAIFSTPTSTDFSTPSSVEIYWWPKYSPRVIHISFLSISLSIPLSFHLPNLSHSILTSFLRDSWAPHLVCL